MRTYVAYNRFPELAELVEKYLPLDIISDKLCRLVVKAAIKACQTGCGMQELLREDPENSEELQRFSAAVQMAPNKATGKESSPEKDGARPLASEMPGVRFACDERRGRSGRPLHGWLVLQGATGRVAQALCVASGDGHRGSRCETHRAVC